MNSTDPEVLDFWIAFNAVEPIGSEASLMAQLSAQVHNLTMFVQATGGVEPKGRFALPFDFMPEGYLPQEEELPKQEESAPVDWDSQEDMVKKMAGF